MNCQTPSSAPFSVCQYWSWPWWSVHSCGNTSITKSNIMSCYSPNSVIWHVGCVLYVSWPELPGPCMFVSSQMTPYSLHGPWSKQCTTFDQGPSKQCTMQGLGGHLGCNTASLPNDPHPELVTWQRPKAVTLDLQATQFKLSKPHCQVLFHSIGSLLVAKLFSQPYLQAILYIQKYVDTPF